MRALYASDHGTYYERMKHVRALFDLAGDRRNSCVQAANMGYVAVVLGALDEAEELLMTMMRVAESLGILRIRAIFQQNVGLLRHLQGRHAEAVPFETQSVATFTQQGDARLATFSNVYLTWALTAMGALPEAYAAAEAALEISKPVASAHATALASLADLELHDARVESALAHATEAYATLERLGAIEETESLVRIAHAEALAAAGRVDEARDAVRRAVESIEARAAKIGIDHWRDSFRSTPENARTFALAKQLASRSS